MSTAGQIEVLDGDLDSEDDRLERHGELVDHHAVEAEGLLVLVVTVNGGLRDQRVELGPAVSAHRGRVPTVDRSPAGGAGTRLGVVPARGRSPWAPTATVEPQRVGDPCQHDHRH